jgi:hypothetical protein
VARECVAELPNGGDLEKHWPGPTFEGGFLLPPVGRRTASTGLWITNIRADGLKLNRDPELRDASQPSCCLGVLLDDVAIENLTRQNVVLKCPHDFHSRNQTRL